MIEDKKKGILIAKDETEAIWYNQLEEVKQYTLALKNGIRRATEDLKLSDRKIAMKFRLGAKENIKQKKILLKIQNEFLKFCKSKIEFPKN